MIGEVLAGDPVDPTARRFKSNAYRGLAEAWTARQHPAEAVGAWRTAIALSSPEEGAEFVPQLACAQARAGKTAEAMAKAETIGDNTCNAACVYSLCAAHAKTTALDKENWQAEAVTLLAMAKPTKKDFSKQIAEDKDLDALRGRADFKALLAPVAPPAEKATKPGPPVAPSPPAKGKL